MKKGKRTRRKKSLRDHRPATEVVFINGREYKVPIQKRVPPQAELIPDWGRFDWARAARFDRENP